MNQKISLVGDKILWASPRTSRVYSGLSPLISPYISENDLFRYPLEKVETRSFRLFEGFSL